MNRAKESGGQTSRPPPTIRRVFLAHVPAHRVPVVVLDVWRGEMTGLELQEQLREHSPQTRAIIMTGHVDPGATNRALNAGAVAFLAKPFDDQQFLSAVQSALPDPA